MNIQTMTMTKREAERKLAAYRHQLTRRTDAEYEMAAKGYEELAKGTPLINLSQVIIAGGFFEDYRPHLAVARADRRQVEVAMRQHSIQYDTAIARNGGSSMRITVMYDTPVNNLWKLGYALVPLVPADVRPIGQLHDFFVLWEVERWSDRSITATPDRDPYLLKPIGGDLYAVIAAWELTDLERAIMGGRRNR